VTRLTIANNSRSESVSELRHAALRCAVGAGGIGDLAISYGYQRFDTSVVILTVIVLLILVQIVQMLGEWLAKLR
jgi:D-methionine transport system permease protein